MKILFLLLMATAITSSTLLLSQIFAEEYKFEKKWLISGIQAESYFVFIK